MGAQITPPGWYPDPSGAPRQRYWDGQQWTAGIAPIKQQRSAGKVLLLTALVLAAVLVFGALSANMAKRSEEPEQATAYMPEAEQGQLIAGLNQPVRDGKFEFVVKSVHPTNGYITAVMDVTNIGAEAQSFFPGNQKLIDTAGRKFEADTMAVYDFNDRGMVLDLNPGMSIQHFVIPFQVPPGTQIAAVEVHDSMFSGGATVSLG